ncbi:MAG: TRAP transporter small permease subunit [Proteobacteria bacterium]|nr:TRAP transporter small permease subunit [Pseudomonadota bacterium]
MIAGFERVYAAYGMFLRVLGVAAGFVTFAMMWLIVANALSRKLLNLPLEGTLEITETLLPIIVFFSLAFTQFRRGHIRVVLLTRHLPRAAQRALFVIGLLIGSLLFAWAAVGTWDFAAQSWAVGETEWGAIRFPLYPTKFIVFVGVLVLSLQLLLDSIRQALIATGSLAGDEGLE